jgi:hypothetical protein
MADWVLDDLKGAKLVLSAPCIGRLIETLSGVHTDVPLGGRRPGRTQGRVLSPV